MSSEDHPETQTQVDPAQVNPAQVDSAPNYEKDIGHPAGHDEFSGNSNRPSALLWIVPLLLLSAVGFLAYTYFGAMTDPASQTRQNDQPEDSGPRMIGTGGLPAIPSLGNFDNGDFDKDLVESTFARITDTLSDLNAENSQEMVQTIEEVTATIDDMALEQLSSGPIRSVNTFFINLRTTIQGQMRDVEDEEAKELVNPALTSMWTKLKDDYNYPRQISLMID